MTVCPMSEVVLLPMKSTGRDGTTLPLDAQVPYLIDISHMASLQACA